MGTKIIFFKRSPRTPLLMNSESDEAEDVENGIRIEVASENGDVDQAELVVFKDEYFKTLFAVLFLLLSLFVTAICLAITHDRMPDTAPLPDIFLDNVSYLDYALSVVEYLLITVVLIATLVGIFHRHRTIVFMRVFLILGIMYLYRAVTFFVTAVPKADPGFHCYDKMNGTLSFNVFASRVVVISSGGGLSLGNELEDKHFYCGDYIFSGHTSVFILMYLAIKQYTPRNFFLLHWLVFVCSTVGVIFLLLSRGHYTVDVVLAYVFSTRLWWAYHTFANTNLKNTKAGNSLRKLWWWRLFRYLEKNVPGPVPNRFSLPLPRSWSSYLTAKFFRKVDLD